jgi:hypothetical protein
LEQKRQYGAPFKRFHFKNRKIMYEKQIKKKDLLKKDIGGIAIASFLCRFDKIQN